MKVDILELIPSLIKSLIFNIRIFGIKRGICIPVLVSYRCKIQVKNKNSIILPDNPYFGVIKIGLNKGHFNRGNKDTSYLRIDGGGTLIFKGKANFAVGSVINIDKSTVEIGNKFSTNDRFTLSSEAGIKIEDNVMIGWNCTLIDGDGHKIHNLKTGDVINDSKPIYIGKNSWIASEVTLMKGASIPDYTVVALGSIVTKKFTEENTIIAGNPANIVKKDIVWMERLDDKAVRQNFDSKNS